MNNGLLIIERLVLESLIKKERTVFELEEDTKISREMLLNILSGLIQNNYISYESGIYNVDKSTIKYWLPEINSGDKIKEEVKDLFTSLVNEYFLEERKGSLKMKKIWLTDSEEIIFKSLLYSLDSFVDNIKADRRKNPKKEITGDQKVILWGYSDYSKLIDFSMAGI